MKIIYNSYFRGWVEVTEEQKNNLIKHMKSGITALSDKCKLDYINSRFVIKE